MDTEGYLRVTGRLKDIIIRGGTNISAAEVEGHVLAHPAVAQVAVVAFPDGRLGEKACAVAPVAGQQATLTDITDFLRGRSISLQKLPERLHVPTCDRGRPRRDRPITFARDYADNPGDLVGTQGRRVPADHGRSVTGPSQRAK